MDIIFAVTKLKKFANNDKLAIKKMGPTRAKLFKKRLENIYNVKTLADLKHLPGNYHQLKGNRKDLDKPFQLVPPIPE